MGSRHGQQTIQGACVSETAVHDHGRRLDQREFRPMAEVPFRPVRQLSEYKGKGASVSRENLSVLYLCSPCSVSPCFTLPSIYGIAIVHYSNQHSIIESRLNLNIGIFIAISRKDSSINERNQFSNDSSVVH